MTSELTAVIVGQGYVGLPVAMRAVEVGMHVVGFDLDQVKTSGLAAGRSHIDDITDADVAAALATGRFRPTSDAADLAGFDVAVITVPTPLRDGAPDLSYIESATRTLATHLRPGATVILESTTYPGTTDELVAPWLEEGSGLKAGVDFHVGYSPERIDPGNATWTFVRTPKVVSGIDAASAAAVQGFYDRLVERTVLVRGTREAEMTKLLENTFRHVNVALVNELAVAAAALGVDMWDVVDAAATKPFGFMPFRPGPGVGGHCLPIDPSYLSWKIEHEAGTPSRFIDIANDINQQMPRFVVDRVLRGMNARGRTVHGARILVLGLAYKPNSSDARETPATLDRARAARPRCRRGGARPAGRRVAPRRRRDRPPRRADRRGVGHHRRRRHRHPPRRRRPRTGRRRRALRLRHPRHPHRPQRRTPVARVSSGA